MELHKYLWKKSTCIWIFIDKIVKSPHICPEHPILLLTQVEDNSEAGGSRWGERRTGKGR